MRSLTRSVVPFLIAAVATATVGLGLGAPAYAAVGVHAVSAYQRAMRADAARQARMAARERPHAAIAARRSPSRPGIFGSASNVERIARDAVTGGQANTQVEPDVAMDPNNPNDVVAVVQQGRFKTGGSADSGFATSLDGGATWTHGNLPGLTTRVGGPFDRSSDPSVVFGPDHTVYASTIDFSFGKKVCPSAVAVQSSTDGGITWSDPVFAENDRTCDVFNDKNWLGVDTNPSSPYFGRLYLVWSSFTKTASPAVLRYSDDHGQTWSDLIYASSQDTQSEGLLPLIASNGDVTLVYDQTVGGQDFEVAQTSTDGGVTFGPIVTIAQSFGAGDPGLRTGGLPAAAIDPTTDEQYVVWQDTRFRSDGLNDVVISSSTDGGATWTDPVAVNGPDPEGQELDHFTPEVAAYGGVVHVTYRTRDFAGKKPSEFVDERYIVSSDGGASFGGELVLGPPTDLKYAAVAVGGGKFLGDYMGVVANAEVAHTVWCVARFQKNSRYNQTLWSATIDR
jgi:hypothetical protein